MTELNMPKHLKGRQTGALIAAAGAAHELALPPHHLLLRAPAQPRPALLQRAQSRLRCPSTSCG